MGVPPPPPCEPTGAHWSADEVEVAPDESGRRIAIVPFTTGYGPSDTANAQLVDAFSRRIIARLGPFHVVPLWNEQGGPETTTPEHSVALASMARAHSVLFGVVEPTGTGVRVTIRIFQPKHPTPAFIKEARQKT